MVDQFRRMLTLSSDVLAFYLRVLVLIFLGQNGFVFVVIFDRFSLKPVAKRGWDVYVSSLLLERYGWNGFSIQGAKGIE